MTGCLNRPFCLFFQGRAERVKPEKKRIKGGNVKRHVKKHTTRGRGTRPWGEEKLPTLKGAKKKQKDRGGVSK